MSEAKPICVIYFPDTFIDGMKRNWIYEYMGFLNGDERGGRLEWHSRKDYYKDYYWFCFYGDDINEPRFEVFNTNNFTPAQFDEIKSMIDETMQKIKTNEHT